MAATATTKQDTKGGSRTASRTNSSKGRKAQQAPAPTPALAPVKVPAGEVQVGDQVGTKKAGPFAEVAQVNDGATSVRLVMAKGGNLRPRKTTPVWVLREQQPDAPAQPAAPTTAGEQYATWVRAQDGKHLQALKAGDEAGVALLVAALAAKPGMAMSATERNAVKQHQLAQRKPAGTSSRAGSTTRKRDPKLAAVAAHANAVADAKGNRLGDRVQPGNVAKAQQALATLVDGSDGAAVLAHFGVSRGKLATYAGTGDAGPLSKATTEARRAFGKLDPANFNGRRGAAIIVACADERDGKVTHAEA